MTIHYRLESLLQELGQQARQGRGHRVKTLGHPLATMRHRLLSEVTRVEQRQLTGMVRKNVCAVVAARTRQGCGHRHCPVRAGAGSWECSWVPSIH